MRILFYGVLAFSLVYSYELTGTERKDEDKNESSKLPQLKQSKRPIVEQKIQENSDKNKLCNLPPLKRKSNPNSQYKEVSRLSNLNSGKTKSYSDKNPPIMLTHSPILRTQSDKSVSSYNGDSPIIELLKKKNWPKNPDKLSEP